ncbi:group 3 secretory phospholipase A2-like [Uloborus diversus]|uniref:group 3 secretory phospholipase A2-like n=1 Tax=Uloborus diversus TaxID=327109 RepID=UPI0024099787|nr:group 3 secretory phospholipase A2-like [Uloborus diversus]
MKYILLTLCLCLSWSQLHCEDLANKSFYLQRSLGKNNDILLVITWMQSKDAIVPMCKVISNREGIDTLKSMAGEALHLVSEQEMEYLLEDCSAMSRKLSPSENEVLIDQEHQQNGLPVIFPGTKWCGAGDIAKNYDDLGLHQDTDRCCRAHDLCDDILLAGETRNNLTNKSPFTALSCKCDDDFYKCLDRVNSLTSNTVGNMYFNVLRRKCYKLDYPTTNKCIKYRTFLKITCLEYEKDKKSPKVYQWVAAKKYKKIPFPGPLTITLPSGRH